MGINPTEKNMDAIHANMTRLDSSSTRNELATENQQLREHLAELFDQAHRNQQIMQRHQALDLKMISAGGFTELLESIFVTLAKVTDLDIVTLCLLDPGSDIRRILADLNIDISGFPNLLFAQQQNELGDLHRHLVKPILGPYTVRRHSTMFPTNGVVPKSVATVPLLRHKKLIGCLNFGSVHETRFTRTMATDFIEHQACIVAICIENVINNERLKHIGLTDPLTGVHNRRYIERRMSEEMGRARRQEYTLSCLFIDIDHFKRVNDTVGHQGGDDVLCEVATRIKAELRLSDALGRFGGEEFVVLLIDADNASASIVAERIRSSVADTPLVIASTGEKLPVTVSIGVATLTTQDYKDSVDEVAQQLLAQADQALYQAKENGRNRVICAL